MGHEQVDLGVRPRQFLVELRVVRRDLIDQIVEDLRYDGLVGLAVLNGHLAVLGQLLDAVYRKLLLRVDRLVHYRLGCALPAQLQIPQLIYHAVAHRFVFLALDYSGDQFFHVGVGGGFEG